MAKHRPPEAPRPDPSFSARTLDDLSAELAQVREQQKPLRARSKELRVAIRRIRRKESRHRRKTVRHRLVTFLSAASLLLCVAVCVLWTRSRSTADVVTHAGHRRVRLVSLDGGLFVESFKLTRRDGWAVYATGPRLELTKYAEWPLDYYEDGRKPPIGSGSDARWQYESGPPNAIRFPFGAWGSDHGQLPELKRGMAGRKYSSRGNGGQEEFWLSGWRAWMPYWLIVVATALPPAWWGRRAVAARVAARRAGRNLCPSCGYDLRATPDRCPECGREAATA